MNLTKLRQVEVTPNDQNQKSRADSMFVLKLMIPHRATELLNDPIRGRPLPADA